MLLHALNSFLVFIVNLAHISPPFEPNPTRSTNLSGGALELSQICWGGIAEIDFK